MKSLSLTQPHAIVMVGIPGCGKTTFAEKFSETFNAPFVNQKSITQLAASKKDASTLVDMQISELIKTKQSILVETDVSTRQKRLDLVQAFKKFGYNVLFVWVQTDVETARQRHAKDKTATGDFDSAVKRFAPPLATEKPLVISGKHTYASQARVVLKRLSEPRADISSHKRLSVRRENNILIQ